MDEAEPAPPDWRLAMAALVLLAIYAVGAFVTPDPDLDFLFGVDAWRAAGTVLFLGGAALLLVLVLAPGVADWIGVSIGVWIGRTLGRLPGLPLGALVLAGSLLSFALLPVYRLSGDALPVVMRAARGEVYPSNALTDFVFQFVMWFTGEMPPAAIRAVSVLAGGVHVVFAMLIARECFPAGPRRVALAVLLLTPGTAVIFFGSVEVYAGLAAAITVYLWFGVRVLKGRGGLTGPSLAAGVAFCLHGSAGLLLPSLALLANDARLRPLRIGRVLRAGAVFLVPPALVLAVLYLAVWRWAPPAPGAGLYGSFFGLNDQGPLLPLFLTKTNVLYRYAVFDPDHLAGVGNLLLLVAPVGVLLFLLAPRGSRGGAEMRFAGTAAGFLVLFPVVWNVAFPLRIDWDLFSPMGIPLSLLGGLAFLRAGATPGTPVKVAAISLFCLVPFVLESSGDLRLRRDWARDVSYGLELALGGEPPPAPDRAAKVRAALAETGSFLETLDPHGVENRIGRGNELMEGGALGAAERVFREALRNEPGNPAAREGLGTALFRAGRFDEAEPILRLALTDATWRLPIRADLARIRLAAGDRAGAVFQLERGLRTSCGHPMGPAVLRELARLREEGGEADVARELRRLAEGGSR